MTKFFLNPSTDRGEIELVQVSVLIPLLWAIRALGMVRAQNQDENVRVRIFLKSENVT